jgi:phage terminase large subunit
VQRFRIFVHINSQNLQRELENYTWQRDRKTEQILDKPIDEFNHGMDAMRYWGMEELEPVTPIRDRQYIGHAERETQYSPFESLFS